LDVELAVRTEAGRTVVSVVGEIDVYSAPQLRQCLLDVISGGAKHLIVDLDGVTFMDSSGLGVLVGALKRVRVEEGSLWLVCDRSLLVKTFRITGLTKVFPIFVSLPE
jgi:anti-sigma B factor antagonist